MSKKLLILGAVVVLLVAIPLTVYLAQKQQETRSRAQRSTNLSLIESGKTSPSSQSAPIQKKVGDIINLDVVMDQGTNVVTAVDLHIVYDPTKLATSSSNTSCSESICNNPNAFPETLSAAKFTPGNIYITLGRIPKSNQSVDVSNTFQKTAKIATVTFETKDTTTTPTQVSFGNQTRVLSSAKETDEAAENVLSATSNAFIAIAAGPTPSPTPTPIAGTNQPPVCTALNVDRTPSGTAPFSITFTANGTDSDGTINKVTFDFGDGPVKDVEEGGKIGTKSVSAQIAHTYNNAGTFKALAILTDDKGAVSTSSASCTQTITVTPGVGGSGSSSSSSSAIPTLLPTATPTSTPTPTSIPQQLPVENPGPSNTIVGVGVVGAILSIVGALLFFAL